jgi:hypothetical protein
MPKKIVWSNENPDILEKEDIMAYINLSFEERWKYMMALINLSSSKSKKKGKKRVEWNP